MHQSTFLTIAALIIGSSFVDAGIIDRAEATELRRSSGKVEPRVNRHKDGHIERLQLNDMKMSSKLPILNIFAALSLYDQISQIVI